MAAGAGKHGSKADAHPSGTENAEFGNGRLDFVRSCHFAISFEMRTEWLAKARRYARKPAGTNDESLTRL